MQTLDQERSAETHCAVIAQERNGLNQRSTDALTISPNTKRSQKAVAVDKEVEEFTRKHYPRIQMIVIDRHIHPHLHKIPLHYTLLQPAKK
jgi:hypothetical protein